MKVVWNKSENKHLSQKEIDDILEQGTTMKQRKPLKLFVPERAEIRHDDLILDILKKYKAKLTPCGSVDGLLYLITRPEIHELVKAHAEKLGYDYSHISKYAKYVYLNDDGFTQYGSTDSTFNNDVHHKEIQWQNFLKLTPGDVEDKTEHIKSLRGKYKGFFSTTTTDRNEKAWELFLAQVSNPYCMENGNFEIMRRLAFQETDNFLKQAGNK